MPFKVEKLDIPGLLIFKPAIYEDQRGIFYEAYKKSDMESHGVNVCFVQWNHVQSMKWVLRGLHYQIHSSSQGKILRVISGEIFDVAVDIRKGSPWFGKWAAVNISSQNRRIFWIPPGFAHGYMTLIDNTVVIYGVTSEYDPGSERGIRWDDPSIAIDWPVAEPIVNERDKAFPLLDRAENPFIYQE